MTIPRAERGRRLRPRREFGATSLPLLLILTLRLLLACRGRRRQRHGLPPPPESLASRSQVVEYFARRCERQADRFWAVRFRPRRRLPAHAAAHTPTHAKVADDAANWKTSSFVNCGTDAARRGAWSAIRRSNVRYRHTASGRVGEDDIASTRTRRRCFTGGAARRCAPPCGGPSPSHSSPPAPRRASRSTGPRGRSPRCVPRTPSGLPDQ